VFQRLASSIEQLAGSREELSLGTSCIEKHGTGLFTASSTPPKPSYTAHRCKQEVCHAHASDGSLHMSLHPADAKLVLEACWGERHPLSRGGKFERFVPADFVMVYSPRDQAEVETVMRIIKAGAWFVGGSQGDIESDIERRHGGYATAEMEIEG
jgi:hypothetical protein